MNIEVSKDNVVILNKTESPHENEYNITECNFTFDEFTDSFQVKRAIFTILSTREMYEIDIINGKCFTPVEVLKHEYETIKLGVYGYNIEIVDEKETLKERFSPSYDTFVVPTGSYEEGALSPEIITPSQYDIYSQALQEGLDDVAEALEEVSHVDINAEQLEHGASVTITNRNNEEKTVVVNDGYTPVKGEDYFTTSEIEEIENTVKTDVITELDFDNTVNDIKQDIQDLNTNKASKTELEEEITARELADTNLQGQIDAISSSKDVVDIVGTYSDLQNYDISTLTEDDVIKVLEDSTHNDAMSYYRWSNNTWNYIGSEGPFYTKSETDERLNTKQAKIDSEHKLASDLVDDTNQTHKFTSTNEKNTWNAKYDKPSNGIPKSDLVASVQESLNKADTAIQDVSDKEDKSNKVTEINSSSTDTQYPSAKCVYDSQEEQNEQLAELEMLYNAFPTVSDEDTTIELNNTAKVKFREIDLKGNTSQETIPEEQGTSVSNTSIYVSDVNTDKENTIEMSGNTYQETTTGKNYFKASSSNYPQGLTITNDATTGEITFSGTTTGSYPTLSNFTEANVPAGEYTFSIDKALSYNITLRFRNASGQYPTSITIPSGSLYNTTTTSYDAVRLEIVYNINSSGIVVPTTTIKPMVESGSTATSFEPYTNGASPNPSYPQQIEVVTGTNNVEVCGKNLFKAPTSPSDYYRVTYNKINNNSISLGYTQSSSSNSSAYARIDFDISRLKPNTKYTLSKSQSIDGTSFSGIGSLRTRLNGVNGNVVNADSITFTTPEILENVGIYFYVAYQNTTTGTATITFDNIQLEEGETTTTYEAYQGNTYQVDLGNIELCKINTYQDRIYKSNNKWYLEKQIGKVTLNGSETWEMSTNFYIRSVEDYAVTNNVPYSNNFSGYTNIQSVTSFPNNIDNVFAFKNSPGEPRLYLKATQFTTKNELTSWLSTHNTIVYYALVTPTTNEITDTNLVNQLNALYNATIYPITNINTDTTNLLPYIDLHYNFVTPSPSPSRPSQVNVVKGNNTITISNSDNTESQVFPIDLGDMELCKIGTYQDYIYENNGNWFKKGNIGKVTLNGSEENWARGTIQDYYRYTLSLDTLVSADTILIYSNYYRGITYNNRNSDYFNTIYANGNIGINTNVASTLTDWKAWLSSNNTTAYYVLATPTDTQITDTTLINQLNNIKKAYSYDTQTNISQTNTDKPFIIYAEAIRSLKDVFE